MALGKAVRWEPSPTWALPLGVGVAVAVVAFLIVWAISSAGAAIVALIVCSAAGVALASRYATDRPS